MNTARYFMDLWHHTIHCNKAVATREPPNKAKSLPTTFTPCPCKQTCSESEETSQLRKRFVVAQSTIAVGHFHFYSEDSNTLVPIRSGTKKCLRFSSFGDESDFSLCTENGINLAWVRHSKDLCNSRQCFALDLNKSTWSYQKVVIEPDCGNNLPIMKVYSRNGKSSSYTWLRSHSSVIDGLALVNLDSLDSIIGIYTLPSHSIRTGSLEFYSSEFDSMTDEDMNLFILLLASSLATVPKSDPKPSLSKSSSTGSDYSSSSIDTQAKKSDLLFQKTHIW